MTLREHLEAIRERKLENDTLDLTYDDVVAALAILDDSHMQTRGGLPYLTLVPDPDRTRIT